MKVWALLLLSGCVTVAAPPPLMTVGGPDTARPGQSEAAVGAGTGASLFTGAHGTGSGWFGRLRVGVTDRIDFGGDMVGTKYGDKGTVTTKLAARYRLHRLLRAEVGAGAADDSNGKSLNADLALVIGSPDEALVWRPYAAVRVAGSLGFNPDVVAASGPPNPAPAPPNALFAFVTGGATGRVSDRIRFVGEFGVGAIKPANLDALGLGIYLGMGLLCVVGSGP